MVDTTYRRGPLVETYDEDLMSGLTAFATAEEIAAAEQAEANSPTTTVLTTTLILGADTDEA